MRDWTAHQGARDRAEDADGMQLDRVAMERLSPHSANSLQGGPRRGRPGPHLEAEAVPWAARVSCAGSSCSQPGPSSELSMPEIGGGAGSTRRLRGHRRWPPVRGRTRGGPQGCGSCPHLVRPAGDPQEVPRLRTRLMHLPSQSSGHSVWVSSPLRTRTGTAVTWGKL